MAFDKLIVFGVIIGDLPGQLVELEHHLGPFLDKVLHTSLEFGDVIFAGS